MTNRSEEIVRANSNIGMAVGEMSESQIEETLMRKGNRKLRKIEVEDAIVADSITSTLMGAEVPPRKAFIVEKAREANIDI